MYCMSYDNNCWKMFHNHIIVSSIVQAIIIIGNQNENNFYNKYLSS